MFHFALGTEREASDVTSRYLKPNGSNADENSSRASACNLENDSDSKLQEIRRDNIDNEPSASDDLGACSAVNH